MAEVTAGAQHRLSRLARKCFTLDLISLYISRRLLGVVLFARFVHRLSVAMLAADGRFQFLPASTFETSVLSAPEIVFGGLALAVAVGYQNRTVLVGLWLTSVVLFSPDQGGLSYGLKILQGCLFWSMFLPTFSRTDEPSSLLSQRVVSVASAGLLIQLSLIYHSGGLTKAEYCWLHDATALSHVLTSAAANLGPFAFVLDYPEVLKLVSRLVLLFEIAAPIFLLSPVATGLMRTIIAVVMIGMHAGIATLMEIGVFPYLCIAIWLSVAPHWWWAWLFRTRTDEAPPRVGAALSPRFQMALLIPLLWVVAANVIVDYHETVRPIDRIYGPVRRIGVAAGLDQHWIMFNDPCRGIGRDYPTDRVAGTLTR